MAYLRRRGRTWYYTVTDENNRRDERKGTTDKRVTEQLAVQAEAEIIRIRSGLIDPGTAARRKHSSRPLFGHLADWHNHLLARGGTAKHATLNLNRARRVAALAAGAALAEIDPPRTATAVERGRIARKVDDVLA